MKKILSLFILVSITGFSLHCKKAEKETTITVSSIFGDVKVISQGTEKSAQIGSVLAEGDTITTGEKSIADLLYAKKGVIRVQQNSSIKIASLISKTSDDTQLDMETGKVYVTISKITKGSFKVKTRTAVASVRGTSFRVTADINNLRLDVLKGKVKINPVKDNKIIEDVDKLVETNQSVEIDDKTVENIVEEKKEIAVKTLSLEDIKEIKDEVKDIKTETIEKLDSESKKEFKEEVLSVKKEEKDDKKDEQEKQKLIEQQRKLALKRQQDESSRKDKERLEIERKKKEQERIAKEKKEKERKKQEERDRASNIPTL